MNLLFQGQIPKDPDYPSEIEDAYLVNLEQGKVVLCDGASESFDSKSWATLLTDGFIKPVELQEEILAETIKEYSTRFDFSTLPWSKQAAFGRGSFSTLLIVKKLNESNSLKILSVGDSQGVLLDGEDFITAFPYSKSGLFHQRPELLSTKSEQNHFISEPLFLENHETIWNLQDLKTPVILCMTDALAEWAMRNFEEGSPKWQELCSIGEISSLEKLVIQERLEKRMRVDDTTLITLLFKE